MSFYVEAIETSVAVNMLLIEVKASISMADIGRSNYLPKIKTKPWIWNYLVLLVC